MIINTYALSQNTQYIKNKNYKIIDHKGVINPNTTIVGDFNTTTLTNRWRQINKETSQLNYTLDQVDVTNVYRIFHPKAAE
jgi:endonuclease/exonuclease/phosphatase family metal-dependent hydrolase